MVVAAVVVAMVPQLVAVVVEVAAVEVVVAYPHMLARNNVFLLTYCLVDLCSLKAHLRSR